MFMEKNQIAEQFLERAKEFSLDENYTRAMECLVDYHKMMGDSRNILEAESIKAFLEGKQIDLTEAALDSIVESLATSHGGKYIITTHAPIPGVPEHNDVSHLIVPDSVSDHLELAKHGEDRPWGITDRVTVTNRDTGDTAHFHVYPIGDTQYAVRSIGSQEKPAHHWEHKGVLLAHLKGQLNEDVDAIDAWKHEIHKTYPEHSGKIRFVSKENGKHISAEVPGIDRSFGVYDIEKNQGHVLTESYVAQLKNPHRKGTVKHQAWEAGRKAYLDSYAKDPHGKLEVGDNITGPSGESKVVKVGLSESEGIDAVDEEAYGMDPGVKLHDVTYDIYGSNRDKPLYTNTRAFYAKSPEEACDNCKKLLGGTNHRAVLRESDIVDTADEEETESGHKVRAHRITFKDEEDDKILESTEEEDEDDPKVRFRRAMAAVDELANHMIKMHGNPTGANYIAWQKAHEKDAEERKKKKVEEQAIVETLKEIDGKWALVSKKDPSKVLQYYKGDGKPSDEWVKKVERRVHMFEQDETLSTAYLNLVEGFDEDFREDLTKKLAEKIQEKIDLMKRNG